MRALFEAYLSRWHAAQACSVCAQLQMELAQWRERELQREMELQNLRTEYLKQLKRMETALKRAGETAEDATGSTKGSVFDVRQRRGY